MKAPSLPHLIITGHPSISGCYISSSGSSSPILLHLDLRHARRLTSRHHNLTRVHPGDVGAGADAGATSGGRAGAGVGRGGGLCVEVGGGGGWSYITTFRLLATTRSGNTKKITIIIFIGGEYTAPPLLMMSIGCSTH